MPDRTQFCTKDAERRLVSPEGLQDYLDELVASLPPLARAFVRPSGTEDVVRIYAEAKTQEDAEFLIAHLARRIQEQTGGSH